MQFFTKGTASLCGIVDIINDGFSDEDLNKDRLMPRTEELPLYTMEDFNKKVKTDVGSAACLVLCKFMIDFSRCLHLAGFRSQS